MCYVGVTAGASELYRLHYTRCVYYICSNQPEWRHFRVFSLPSFVRSSALPSPLAGIPWLLGFATCTFVICAQPKTKNPLHICVQYVKCLDQRCVGILLNRLLSTNSNPGCWKWICRQFAYCFSSFNCVAPSLLYYRSCTASYMNNVAADIQHMMQ